MIISESPPPLPLFSVFQGLFGTLLLVTLQPLLTIGNVLGSLLLCVLSLLCVPFVAVGAYFSEILLYDDHNTNRSKYTSFFPLLSAFFMILFALVAHFLLPVVLTLLQPLLALFVLIGAQINKCIRLTYDLCVFHCIIRTRARIPISNSAMAYRVAGPGLSAAYHYYIHADVALAALQAKLERMELDIAQRQVGKQLLSCVH